LRWILLQLQGTSPGAYQGYVLESVPSLTGKKTIKEQFPYDINQV
jgi:hypothetical protein